MSQGKILSISILVGGIVGGIMGYMLNHIAWIPIGTLAGVTYANIKKTQSKDL